MKRHLIEIAAVAALAAGVTFAQATANPLQAGRAAQRPGAALRPGSLANLNLTDAQKAQVKQIMQQAKTAAQPVQQQLQQSGQALAAAVKANDGGQIQTLAAGQGAIQGQLLAIQAAARAKVFALLTPDQKTRLEQRQQRIQQLRRQIRALRNNP